MVSPDFLKIILEGPTASGKTSVAGNVAQRLGLPLHAPFAGRRDLYELWFTNPCEALDISLSILAALPSVGVFDRFHLTPQTMMNHPLLFLPLVTSNDITISLDASVDTLMERQRKRGAAEDVDPEIFYRPHYARLAECWNAFYIDTTNFSISEVADRIVERCMQVVSGRPYTVKEGRSKIVKRVDERLLVELKPTLDSYTYGRSEIVPGTDCLRNTFFEKAVKVLQDKRVPVIDYRREGPSSYSCEYCYSLPFECIIKRRAVGTTLYDCPGLFYPNMPFPWPVARFDYRTQPRDMSVPPGYIKNFGLDPEGLEAIAQRAAAVLARWLKEGDYELVDICFVFGFSDDTRIKIISEISPDGMRVCRAGKSYDKDLFRHGIPADRIIEAWTELVNNVV